MGGEKHCQHPIGNSGGICGGPVLAREFCSRHYTAFRNACIANGSWTERDEGSLDGPKPEPWEYTNDAGEAELMEVAEVAVQARKRK
jgi:hypothetical protein